MHFGTQPLEYSPGASRRDADAPAVVVSRRSLFALAPLALFAGGALFGGGATWFARSEDGPELPARAPQSSGPVARGTVEWAVWMKDAPPQQFLAAAGELERVRMSFQSDRRLVPVFEHLLGVALHERVDIADEAGAIAIRCLERMDADHLVLIREERDFADRPLMLREFRRVRGGR